MSNNLTTFIRSQFQDAHYWLEGTMEDVTNEIANKQVHEKAMKIGAQYLHIISGIDDLVNAMVFNQQPLSQGEWKDKTGGSEPCPPTNMEPWAKSVKVDIDQAKKYCTAAFSKLDESLAKVNDAFLEETVDLTSWGVGEKPKSYLLTAMFLNTGVHTGEISNMKGQLGLKGYAF